MRLLVVALLLAPLASVADEGMWTLNAFPSDKVKQAYGFSPSPEWLEHVRLSSARLARGCSGSFVSSEGLVMTNHHCVRRCIEQLSTAKKDLMASGFYAPSVAAERRCPEIEINQLVEIADVTDKLAAATRGLQGKAFNEAQKAEMSRLEKACATSDEVRCDVVTLYRGGHYNLYKYRRFQDVRLVFAPEQSIAFFGGDPDNFNFPRYDLDVAFLRVYQRGTPAQMNHYFKWSEKGASEGELTFISGHPGNTNRLLTVAQLAYDRDVRLPKTLLHLAEMRGYLTMFQTRGKEQKRISDVALFGIENGFKALKGRHAALLDPKFFASKVAAENSLRAKVNAEPKMKQSYGSAWDGIAQAIESYKPFRTRHEYLEGGRGFQSSMFGIARTLVRSAEELPKDNDKRLREYTDNALPMLKQKLFSPAPIYDELEIATLTHSLTKLREELSPDDPIVRQVLGTATPAELAMKLVRGSRLKDLKARRALFDGGKAAIEASKDPFIALARSIDPEARAIRSAYEDQVEGPIKKNSELIAKAMFEVYGTTTYPDATFTLRLSYGQVKGWNERGQPVAPVTRMAGAFERHTGKEPFALPASWLRNQSKLDLQTPMNFCSTNDIIGGNSGSPVINKEGHIVGLVFDGNIHSLGGDYGFDPAMNRAVSVHSQAILESLAKIYRANRLVQELSPASGAARPGSK